MRTLKIIIAGVYMGLFSLPSAADEFKYLFTVEGETEEIILKRDNPKEEPKAETKEETKAETKEETKSEGSEEKEIFKGFYSSLSVGATKVSDIDFGTLGILQFKTGLDFDGSFGYDFGNGFRSEINYAVNGSDFENTTTSAGYVDLKTSTLSLNGLVDFSNTSKLTPFIGVGIGSSKVEVTGANDTVMIYNVIAGGSYNLTDNLDLVGKYTYRLFSDVTLGIVEIIDSYTNTFSAGIKWRY